MMCDEFFPNVSLQVTVVFADVTRSLVVCAVECRQAVLGLGRECYAGLYESRCLHVGSRDVYGRDGSLLEQGGRHME